MERYILRYLPIVISIIAIGISIRSCHVSEEALNYQKYRDNIEKIPILVESTDSINIAFGLNQGNDFLQGIALHAPQEFKSLSFQRKGRPLKFPRKIFELAIENFFAEKIVPEDSICVVIDFSLPVFVDYITVIDGTNQILREFRSLDFTVVIEKRTQSAIYNGSRFIERCPIPLVPDRISSLIPPDTYFSDSTIYLRDQKSLSEFLSSKLSPTLRNILDSMNVYHYCPVKI